jgi:hypothetical protein
MFLNVSFETRQRSIFSRSGWRQIKHVRGISISLGLICQSRHAQNGLVYTFSRSVDELLKIHCQLVVFPLWHGFLNQRYGVLWLTDDNLRLAAHNSAPSHPGDACVCNCRHLEMAQMKRVPCVST